MKRKTWSQRLQKPTFHITDTCRASFASCIDGPFMDPGENQLRDGAEQNQRTWAVNKEDCFDLLLVKMEVWDQGEKSHTALWTMNLKTKIKSAAFQSSNPTSLSSISTTREGWWGSEDSTSTTKSRSRALLEIFNFCRSYSWHRASLILSGAKNMSSFSLDPPHQATCVNNLYSRLFEQGECRVGWTGHWSNPRLQEHVQVKTHLRERRIPAQCLEQGKYDHLFKIQMQRARTLWEAKKGDFLLTFSDKGQCENCSLVKYLKGTWTYYADDRNTWTEELKLCSIEDILLASTEESLAGTYLEVVFSL